MGANAKAAKSRASPLEREEEEEEEEGTKAWLGLEGVAMAAKSSMWSPMGGEEEEGVDMTGGDCMDEAKGPLLFSVLERGVAG